LVKQLDLIVILLLIGSLPLHKFEFTPILILLVDSSETTPLENTFYCILEIMVRTIYLVIFSNGARPAHYAVFVPSGDAGKVGKLIYVIGTTATGFFRELKRNYDFNATQRMARYYTSCSSRWAVHYGYCG
jgi:hypothetical protein